MFRNIRNREIGKKVTFPSLKSTLLKEARRLNQEIERKILVGITRPGLRAQVQLEINELKRQLAQNKKFWLKNFKK